MNGDHKSSEGATPAPGSHQFVRMAELERRISLKKSQIWKLIREGRFPAPVKEGRSSLFILSEIDSWAQALIDKSRGGAK
jgi:prophage regulatory protein